MSDDDDDQEGPAAPDTEDAQPDPLGNLFERMKLNVEAAYAPEVVAAAAKLKRGEPGKFVTLVRWLKAFKKENPASGFSLTLFNQAVDKLIAGTSAVVDAAGDAATRLVELSRLADAHYLNLDNEEAYADFKVKNQLITGPVTGAAYQRWLTMFFYKDMHRAPPREAFKAAIATIEARTFSEGVYHRLFPRIGHWKNDDGDTVIYLDRGSSQWDAIKIDHAGWRPVERAPVKFIRPDGGIGELPIPERSNKIKINVLEAMLNLRSRRDFVLLIGFVLGCYQPAGPFLQVLLLGPHGSAKTSAMKRALALIDPVINDPLAPPREDREVLITAQTTFVQGFDNVKSISVERSAVYCRLSTGGGQRGRMLYTDKTGYGLWARRPLIQTSTRMVVKESDHVDRTVLIGMGDAFEDKNAGRRKPETVLDREFADAWPKLLACILDAVVEGLRRQRADEPIPENPPRMADFVVWAHRCETGLGWKQGTILNAYREAIAEYAQDVAELDPVASAVIAFMLDHPDGWTNTTTMLLALLGKLDAGRYARSKDWPRDAGNLGAQLHELSSVFFRNRLLLRWHRNGRERLVAMTWMTEAPPGQANGASRTANGEATQPETSAPEGPIPL
jgi:hypothetical protein